MFAGQKRGVAKYWQPTSWGDSAANQLTPSAPLLTTSGDEAALPHQPYPPPTQKRPAQANFDNR